jgi:hypothetical protein
MNSFGSALVHSFGKTAGKIGAQALVSNLGIEEEDSEEDSGIFDSITSGLAALNAGDNGGGDAGGGGEPTPTSNPAAPAGGGEYVLPPTDPGVYDAVSPTDPSAYGATPPLSDPGACYTQDPSMATALSLQPTGAEYQTGYSAQIQYSTSYSVELPTIECHHNSGGSSHHTHNGNMSGHAQTNTQWNTFPNQANLPTGAQQPYRPQPPLHTIPHQAQSPGWSPYHRQ